MNDHKDDISIQSAWREYQALPSSEWRKDYFDETTGGYVATHVLKGKDTMKRIGIAKEVTTCLELAKTGKRLLRLPENTLDKIDNIIIDGQIFRQLLKFKPGNTKPKGYPDVYFDGQTWDFKTSTFKNEDSLRHTIKEGQKADAIILIVNTPEDFLMVESAIKSEIGRRTTDGTWVELPDVYCWFQGKLDQIWNKKRQGHCL